MRLLKFFLWIILAASIGWGSIIVLGPKLINRAVNAMFVNPIEISRLDVSPKLEITAAFIKFDIPMNKGSAPLQGIVRGVDLSWKLADGFALIATVGPSRIEGIGALEAATIRLTPAGLFSWHSANLAGLVSSLSVPHFTAGQVNITANLSDNIGSIKTARIIGQDVKNKRADLSAKKLVLEFSDFNLRSPIAQQEIPFSLNISDSLIGAAAYGQGVQLSGALRSPSVVFETLANKVVFDDFGVSFDGISAFSTYDLSSNQFGPTSRISAAVIKAERVGVNVTDYSAAFHVSENKILQTGKMNLESLSLKTGATFFGKISDAAFEYEVSIPKTADMTFKEYPLNVDAKLKISDDLQIVSSLNSSLMARDLTKCLTMNCALGESLIHYSVELPSAKLTGESHCDAGFCTIDQMRHSVTTDNTDVFFAELAKERVFSPIILPMAYYAVRGSSPIGLGHRLDF